MEGVDKAIKTTINTRKDALFTRETERLKTIGGGAGWYAILKKTEQ